MVCEAKFMATIRDTRARLKSVIMFFDNVNVLCSLSPYNLFAV